MAICPKKESRSDSVNILTNENTVYNLDHVPDEVEDIRYCIFDCSDKNEIDYYFVPLIFLESFFAPAVVIRIGDREVKMPMDWSILVCDDGASEAEIMPLTSLNDRGFKTFAYNPLNHMIPQPVEIEIVNVYTEVKWFFPKMKNGAMLVVPVDDSDIPDCVLFVKEMKKIPNPLDIAHLF